MEIARTPVTSNKGAEIGTSHMKMLARFLPLPAHSLNKRMIEVDGSVRGAMIHAAATGPTFIRK